MARHESDREDLLRDATALVERIELAPADSAAGEHVVIGFRADGGASVYFGAEPAYHFNSAGELRRAYQDGLLYKAEQGRLIAMERVRTTEAVELRRRELPAEEQRHFLAAVESRLRDLRESIAARKLSIVGQVPPGADVMGRAMQWLLGFHELMVATSPHAR